MRLGMNDKVELSRRITMTGTVHFCPKNMLPFFLHINDFVSFGVKTDKYQLMNDRMRELKFVSMNLLTKIS